MIDNHSFRLFTFICLDDYCA